MTTFSDIIIRLLYYKKFNYYFELIRNYYKIISTQSYVVFGDAKQILRSVRKYSTTYHSMTYIKFYEVL